MGVAKHNRGSALIRRQVDADLQDKMPGIERRAERQRIRELEAELARVKSEHDRTLKRAKHALACSRAEADRLRQERNNLQYMLSIMAETAHRFRRSWRKASVIIRSALTPKQYHAARDAAAETHPELFRQTVAESHLLSKVNKELL